MQVTFAEYDRHSLSCSPPPVHSFRAYARSRHTPCTVLRPTPCAPPRPEYLYTLRLCAGIATCMDAQGDRLLLGSSSGSLAALALVRGSANKLQLGLGVGLEDGLELGVEEYSDDDDSDEDEEDE